MVGQPDAGENRMPDRRLIALPAAAALGLALVAGGAGASGGVTAAKLKHKATLSADPNGNLTFNKKKIRVKHGKVTLVMTNPKGTGSKHGIGISGHGVDKDGKNVKPGHTSRVTVKHLAKGKYTFYCPFDGHRTLGMKGKLIVK
jgi:uncharacterized cupredoxin-like copper-binding protein